MNINVPVILENVVEEGRDRGQEKNENVPGIDHARNDIITKEGLDLDQAITDDQIQSQLSKIQK